MREPGPGPADDSPAGAARRAAGTLEAEVLGILREASGPLSPGEVRQRLAGGQRGGPSYNTGVNIVSRLDDNGPPPRPRGGRAVTSTPVHLANPPPHPER